MRTLDQDKTRKLVQAKTYLSTRFDCEYKTNIHLDNLIVALTLIGLGRQT